MSHECERVIYRMGAALDDHRFDDLPALYTADAKVGDRLGRDEVVAAQRASHEPIPFLQHQVTGVLVDEDGDDAVVRANIVATFCDAEHRPTFEAASVLRARLRRSGEVWQFSEISLDPVWSRGSPPTGGEASV